jgi:F-type H+-transporting ATPase subunit beta
MFVSKIFTGIDGINVPVEETIESFELLVKGDLDAFPEQAFLNVGGASDVERKSAELQAN